MSTQELTDTNTVQALSVNVEKNQYTIWQILGIWASAALPMGLIYWVVIPGLRPHLTVEPGFVFYGLSALALVWLGVLAVSLTFNYLLGEELIFRGILLPKMTGVFGKWDWLANHILFSAYHLHFFWTTPAAGIRLNPPCATTQTWTWGSRS